MELMDPSVPRLRHDTSFSRAGSMPNQGDFESSSLGVSGHFTPSQYSKIKNKNKKIIKKHKLKKINHKKKTKKKIKRNTKTQKHIKN